MICINQKLDIYLYGHAAQNNAFNDIKEQKRQKTYEIFAYLKINVYLCTRKQEITSRSGAVGSSPGS